MPDQQVSKRRKRKSITKKIKKHISCDNWFDGVISVTENSSKVIIEQISSLAIEFCKFKKFTH